MKSWFSQCTLFIVAIALSAMVAACSGDGSTPTSTPNPLPKAQCADGVDNDGDGLIDAPADPGCESSWDDDEKDVDTGKSVSISSLPSQCGGTATADIDNPQMISATASYQTNVPVQVRLQILQSNGLSSGGKYEAVSVTAGNGSVVLRGGIREPMTTTHVQAQLELGPGQGNVLSPKYDCMITWKKKT